MLQPIRASDARYLAKRKGTGEVKLSYDAEKVPAVNMGLGSLRKKQARVSSPKTLCTRMPERS